MRSGIACYPKLIQELPMLVASIFIAELSLCIDFSFSAPDMAVGCYG